MAAKVNNPKLHRMVDPLTNATESDSLLKASRKVYHFRGVKEVGPLFILLWSLLVFSYQHSAITGLVTSINRRFNVDLWVATLINAVLSDCLPKLLYPFAGWIADAKLGRYKVMRYSLWIMWVGAVLHLVVYLVRYTLRLGDAAAVENDKIVFTLPLLVVAYVINAVGIAGFSVNLIPFGIDQMENCSGDQMSSFIHWYYWTINFNFGIIVQFFIQSLSFYCAGELERQLGYDLVIYLIQLVFLSAAVCLDLIFSYRLKKDPKIHNPIKKVKDISTFILKNNKLVGHRRAYTFTYNTPPTRSDFAKQSYGGPFEDDEVEEVTAFWRIIVLVLTVGFGAFVVQTVSC